MVLACRAESENICPIFTALVAVDVVIMSCLAIGEDICPQRIEKLVAFFRRTFHEDTRNAPRSRCEGAMEDSEFILDRGIAMRDRESAAIILCYDECNC